MAISKIYRIDLFRVSESGACSLFKLLNAYSHSCLRFTGINNIQNNLRGEGQSDSFFSFKFIYSPKKKKCKKTKWLSEEALQIAVKRRDTKGKEEKERHTHLNAE